MYGGLPLLFCRAEPDNTLRGCRAATSCPPGYVIDGKTGCKKCPGTHVPNADQTACGCQGPNQRVLSAAAGTCDACTAGSFGPGVNTEQTCSGGSCGTGIAGSSTSGACDRLAAGYYFRAVDRTVAPCKSGAYCPGYAGDNAAGTFDRTKDEDQGAIACPAGTSTAGGVAQKAATDCKLLPGFMYCPTTGSQKYANGYLGDVNCPTSGTGIIPCPEGGFCSGGGASSGASVAGFTACTVAGRWSKLRSTSDADCSLLSPKYYWSGSAPVLCESKSFCNGGLPITSKQEPYGMYECTKGSICLAARTTFTLATACDCDFPGGAACVTPCAPPLQPGTYWTTGQAVATCTAGSFCLGGGRAYGTAEVGRTACPTGRTSLAGAKVQADCNLLQAKYKWTGTEAAACDAGEYCPEGRLFTPPATEGGSTSSVGGTPCPTGITSGASSSTADDCKVLKAGYYVPSGYVTGTAATTCPANSYCVGNGIIGYGEVGRSSCPAGSTSGTGSSKCKIDAGYYYDGSDVKQCPAGSYCEGGGDYPTTGGASGKTACPTIGTTSDAGASSDGDCNKLKPGYYFDGTTVELCEAGSYCSGGATFSTGTAIGSSACPSDTTSAAGASICSVAAGSYWTGTAVATCRKGSYCTGGTAGGQGAAGESSCPTGSSSAAGAKAPSDCTIISAGYMWHSASSSVEICPQGSYCAGGDYTSQQYVSRVECPSGTTTPSTGAKKADECSVLATLFYYDYGLEAVQLCLPGYRCAGGASMNKYAVANIGLEECLQGFSSYAGSNTCSLTAPGWYYEGALPMKRCPSGSYCVSDTFSYGGSGPQTRAA